MFLFFVVVLWPGCLTGWMTFLTRKEIDARTWTDCKLFYFLFYFGRQYSSSLLVLMSLEKCFAVYFPLKSKTVCTVKTAKWVTSTVGIVLTGYDSVYFVVMESVISKSSGRKICRFTGNYRVVLYAVDSALYSFGPFILMSLTTFSIVLKFMRAKCRSNQSNSTESTNQALSKSATRGTTMVITVSVTFLILTAPTAVPNALSYFIRLGSFPLYRAFMNSTQYLNHSINGVLYCIVGSRFRRELMNLLNRNQKRVNTCTVYSTSSMSVTNVERDAA